MSNLTLYIGDKRYSSWSLRPWLALKHTGAPFREELIRIHRAGARAEILKHSPSGRVPALRDGDLVVWESLAICEYLAERFPDARLWPEDARARATARAVSAEMHAGFEALREICTMDLQRPPSPVPMSDAVLADVERIQALWEECRLVYGRVGGPFLFGRFTIADAMYAPVVARCRTYQIPLEGAAQEYADAVWALPAMREWVQAALVEQ